jgi:hypothetical protein
LTGNFVGRSGQAADFQNVLVSPGTMRLCNRFTPKSPETGDSGGLRRNGENSAILSAVVLLQMHLSAAYPPLNFVTERRPRGDFFQRLQVSQSR